MDILNARVVTIVLGSLLLLGIAGCGPVVDEVPLVGEELPDIAGQATTSIILTPTATPTVPTEALAVTATPEISLSATLMPGEVPIMPGAQLEQGGVQEFEEHGLWIASYSITARADEIDAFHRRELEARGWEWVYTDIGGPFGLLAAGYRRGIDPLIGVSAFSFTEPPEDGSPPTFIVSAGHGVDSGAYLLGFLLLATDGLMTWPNAGEMADPSDAEFASPWLAFGHPGDWISTHSSLAGSYPLALGALEPSGSPLYCGQMDPLCLAQFMVMSAEGSQVAPVTIRVHPNEAGLTQEMFELKEWDRLRAIAPSGHDRETDILRLEYNARPDTLETIQVGPIVVADGVTGQRRVYRWEGPGVNLAEKLAYISTATFFEAGDAMVEFRTDFVEEEWPIFEPIVAAVMSTIRRP